MIQNLTSQFLQKNIFFVCVILILGFLAHSLMLTATFKGLDDSISIIDNTDIKSFSNIDKVFTTSFFGGKHYYRPMVSLSFMVEHFFFGLKPFYYNLTNLILHLSIAVSVFFLILFILKDRLVSFFAALLFAVHPIHWEAVSNIPGRSVILSTLFGVTSFLFYLFSSKKNPKVIYYLLSLMLFTCGLLSKESAAMFPILLISYIFFVEKDSKKYVWTVPYFLIIVVYIMIRNVLGIAEIYPWRSLPEYVLGFLTFLRACITYVRIFILPVDLYFDRARELFVTFHDGQLWATVCVVATGCWLMIKCCRRLTGPVLFFAAWFCIELFPVSQLVTTIGVRPGYISTAEHFLYMPSIGFFVL